MLQFQPDPGPYHCEPLVATEGADIAICCNGQVIAVVQHDPDVQTSQDPNYSDVVWLPEQLSNASLLAASWGMYKALKDLQARGLTNISHDFAISQAETPYAPSV